MDEKALNELLECSVCLDRLDSQSKVLPCQHTFCRWCLEEIVSSKKELRCPECRYLVEVDIQDLPANILLIRLLEGMKNAARSSGSSAKSSPTKTADRTGSGPSSPAHVQDGTHRSHKCLDSTSLPCAKALYNYDASEPGDLGFKKSDIILLRKQVDENWYHGELNGKQGFFPATYVQVLNPMPNKENPSCKALYDFQSDCNERDCLNFHKDETLSIIRRVDDNWIEGKLGTRIGIFPSSFVELNDAAKLLINFQASLAKNGNSLPNDLSNSARNIRVPATPHTSASMPVSSQPHCTSAATPRQAPEGVTTTMTSTGPSTSHLAPSNNNLGVTHRPHKRHSLTTLSPARSPPPHNHRHSMEVSLTLTTTAATTTSATLVTSTASAGVSVSSARHGAQVTAQEGSKVALNIYTALYNYKPQKEDEMQLTKGEFYSVTEKCQDGWYKGLCLRTGCRGVFPGNYVQNVKVSSSKLAGFCFSRNAASTSGATPSSTSSNKCCNTTSTQPQTAVTQSAKNSRTNVTRTHSFPKTSPLAGTEFQVRLRNHGVRPGGSCLHPRPITNITQAQLRNGHSQSVTSMAQTRAHSMLLSPADVLHVAGDHHQNALSDTDDTTDDAENRSHSLPSTASPSALAAAGVACPARTSTSLSSASNSSPRLSRRHTHSDKCKSRGRVRSSHATARHSMVPTISPPVSSATTSSSTMPPPPNVTLGATGYTSQTEPGPASPRDSDREKERKKEKERLPVSSYLLKKLSAGIPARIRKCRSPGGENSRTDIALTTTASASSPQHKAGAGVSTVTTPVRTSSSSSAFPASHTNPAHHNRSGSAPSDNSQGAVGVSSTSSHHKKSNSVDSHQGHLSNKPAKVKPLVRDRYRCIAPYPPQSDSELELKVNEVVYVHRKRDDGWFKGTLLSSGKTGLFPGSFVERC